MKALDLLASLVIEDGRTWGDAATRVQLDDARAVLDGERPYNYITRARGYSKTADLAGVALAMLLTLPPGSRLYWLAADEDQGRLVLDSIAGYSQRTGLLQGVLDVQARRVVATGRDNRLDVLAADAASAWGLRPAAVFADELAQWPSTPNARRLWEAVSSAVLKVSGARLVVLTTAGDPAHEAARVLDHARSSELWRVSETPGPPPWTDPEKLAEQRSRLPGAIYRQLFENEWVPAEGAFLDPVALDDCFTLPGPASKPEPRQRYVAGLDLGHTSDRTAFALGHRTEEAVILDRLQVWSGSRDAPISFAAVERAILTAFDRFRFRLSADPWQALHVLERLRAEGLRASEVTFTAAFKQRLASTLLQSVNDRALRLYPDNELRDELLALRLVQKPGGWVFDHRAGGHDDRAIALSLMIVAALDTPLAPRHRVRVRVGTGNRGFQDLAPQSWSTEPEDY